MTTFVCDEQHLFAAAVAAALRTRACLQGSVTACAPSQLPAAVAAAAPEEPLVLVVSVRVDSGAPRSAPDDLGLVRRLRRQFPEARVVCLAAMTGGGSGRPYLDAGADAVVSRSGSVADLTDAVLDGARSTQRLPLSSGRTAHPHALALRFLTARERQVLDLLVAARSTSEIADELSLTTTTTRSYVQSLMVKLSAHSRVQLVSLAVGPLGGLADAAGAG